jgi:hypothetical protein
MAFNPDEFTSEQVNVFHLNSDKDAGAGALHHTLGLGPTQASPGNHRHNGRDSYRIDAGDLATVELDYTPEGGTDGTQPTFSGDPLITGHYMKIGKLIHFTIEVDFDNITNFGSGQYYLKLPFHTEHPFLVRDGCLHDISGNDQYSISGHCNAGSDVLQLFATASNGRDVPFTNGTPVNLATADNFHIAGTYHAQP